MRNRPGRNDAAHPDKLSASGLIVPCPIGAHRGKPVRRLRRKQLRKVCNDSGGMQQAFKGLPEATDIRP